MSAEAEAGTTKDLMAVVKNIDSMFQNWGEVFVIGTSVLGVLLGGLALMRIISIVHETHTMGHSNSGSVMGAVIAFLIACLIVITAIVVARLGMIFG